MKEPNKIIIESDHAKIELFYKGIIYYALIDLEDIDKVKPYKWHLKNHFVCNSSSHIPKLDRLHFVILRRPARGEVIQFLNNNRLDNRKININYNTLSKRTEQIRKTKYWKRSKY